MALVLMIGGLVLTGLPGLLRRQARSLDPREWARLCLVALAGGVVLVESGLVFLAIPTLLQAAGLPGQGVVCARLLESFAPMGGPLGWLIVLAALALPARAGWRSAAARRTGKAMVIEPWIGEHSRLEEKELVVVSCPDVVACSVEGPPAQVVVSRSLIEILSAAELDVVLRHESAHLGHRHERLLRIGAAFEGYLGFVPWARSSASALRTVLERWADEQAAGQAELDRTALRGALMRVAGVQLRTSVAAIARTDGLQERLEALALAPTAPQLRQRAVMYTPGVVLALVIAAAVGQWSHSIGPACLQVARCIG